MLLLGVLQAQAAGQVAAGSFDLLETQVLASSTASVTFSSLSTYAADYQHLQLRLVTRDTRALTGANSMDVRINGDTGSNYAYHRLRGNGSSVTSLAGSSATEIILPSSVSLNATANAFTGLVIDILDPFETSKNTTLRAVTGYTVSGEQAIELVSGLWNNTAELTSIRFAPRAAGDFAQFSRFSLYGIKAGA